MLAKSAQWPRHTWPRQPWPGNFLHIAVLIGVLMSLALHGCAAMSRDTRAPGVLVDPVGQIRLSWEAPTTKEDSTPSTDITGFRLHYGLTSGTYAFMKNVGSQTTAAVSGLEPGCTYYFAVTAYNSAGNESRPSDEITITAPLGISQAPMLTMDPLRRGQVSRFRVAGTNPQEVVSFLSSTNGEGKGLCSPQLGGLCVDLIDPCVFGEATTDSTGLAILAHTIPADAPLGQTIAIQAIIQRGPRGTALAKTNAITAKVVDR
jgi:Fibronectin type III domain